MSARRWFALLGFVLVSLVLSLGWFAWAALRAPPGQRMSAMGLAGVLNLIELPLAFFLLRLSDYAREWTVRFNVVKLVTAVGLCAGAAAGGALPAGAVAGLAGACGFFAAYTLFLRWNAPFFD